LTWFLTIVQKTAMDTILADINIDGQGAGEDSDVDMADATPGAVQKQEKKSKDKKEKKEKKHKKGKSEDGREKKKRKHAEVNGTGEVEGTKKKKHKSKD
jgi:nucleolar protein 56